MYYEEKWIDGLLYCRHHPNHTFTIVPYIEVSRRLQIAEATVSELKKQQQQLELV